MSHRRKEKAINKVENNITHSLYIQSPDMYVCFAEAKNNYKGVFNSLVAFFTGGSFCHVAIVFEIPQLDGSIQYKECSVVKCKDKRFNTVHLSDIEDMDGWTCFRIQFESAEYEQEAYNYVCNNLLGEEYDDFGSVTEFTFACCFPIGYRKLERRNKKTYCSKLALEILQRTGQFLDRGPYPVSPNELYRMISRNTDTTARWTDVSGHATRIFSGEYGRPTMPHIKVVSREDNSVFYF